MTSRHQPVVDHDNKTGCADNCACPSNNNNNNNNHAPSAEKPAPARGFLRRIFGASALCTCSGAGGFLIGHAGCVVTPLVLAAVGVTTATAGVSALALAFGAAATAGGLYAWHRLRGKQAGVFEKRLVIGSALSGLLVSGAMMHFNGHDHGGDHAHPQPAPVEQSAPHHHHPQHGDHGPHGHHGQAAAKLPPAAAAWFAALDSTRRHEVTEMARQLDMPLATYLDGMCITPPPAPKKAAAPAPGS